MTGLTTVGLSSSGAAGDVAFTNVKNLVEAEMNNGAGNLTVTYNAAVVAGTTDVLFIALQGADYTADASDAHGVTGAATTIEAVIG